MANGKAGDKEKAKRWRVAGTRGLFFFMLGGIILIALACSRRIRRRDRCFELYSGQRITHKKTTLAGPSISRKSIELGSEDFPSTSFHVFLLTSFTNDSSVKYRIAQLNIHS